MSMRFLLLAMFASSDDSDLHVRRPKSTVGEFRPRKLHQKIQASPMFGWDSTDLFFQLQHKANPLTEQQWS